MKASRIWDFRPLVGRVMLGLVLAIMTSSINVAPSFGEDGHDRGDRYERGGRGHDGDRYERRGRGHDGDRYEKRGRGYDRGRYYNKHGKRYYRQPVYRERVYVAPPPVVYAPPEPPGISFFFPPIIFRP
jgi:hypothetical protein